MKLFKRIFPSWSNSYYIVLSIFVIKVITEIFPDTAKVDNAFMSDFIGAFGILYSVLLPLVLIRVLEIRDNVSQEFELEANTTRILYEDSLFVVKNSEIQRIIAWYLLRYVKHVLNNSDLEADGSTEAKLKGDEILRNIRRQLAQTENSRDDYKIMSNEWMIGLIQRLNQLEDIRVTRIEHSKQMFSGSVFQTFAVLSATTFLLPFYISGFSNQTTFLQDLLLGLLTLVVVFLNLIIEDLDKPFSGIWKIHNDAWQRILVEMQSRR